MYKLCRMNAASTGSVWQGRADGPRWHHIVTSSTPTGGVALVGFCSDEGVRRNEGRVGAAAGPAALRAALSGFAVQEPFLLADAGDISTHGTDLESAQRELSDTVRDLIAAGNLVVVLGGGHETSFASHRGAYEALGNMQIVNFDAHFDLRQADRPTSGTPFLQIAEMVGKDAFDYSVIGISKPNNTKVLFDTAEELGVRVVLDEELLGLSPQQAAERALELVAGDKPIHLSIDLDLLPAWVAPGVSAPAGLGVALEQVYAMVKAVASTGRVRLVDVVELNPTYDIDGRTAKVAARLIETIVGAVNVASISKSS